MQTAIDAVFVGKERAFNRRFAQDVTAITWSSRRLARCARLGEGASRVANHFYIEIAWLLTAGTAWGCRDRDRGRIPQPCRGLPRNGV